MMCSNQETNSASVNGSEVIANRTESLFKCIYKRRVIFVETVHERHLHVFIIIILGITVNVTLQNGTAKNRCNIFFIKLGRQIYSPSPKPPKTWMTLGLVNICMKCSQWICHAADDQLGQLYLVRKLYLARIPLLVCESLQINT